MSYKVIVSNQTNGISYDITDLVKTIQWSGSKTVAPRSLVVDIVWTNKGSHDRINVEDGDGLMFLYDGVELFRGVVFGNSITGKGSRNITAYDMLIYFVKNKDSRVYQGWCASDILMNLCDDFSIKFGSVVATGYDIPYRVFENVTLYDMVMTALNMTYKVTGVKYQMYASKWNICLRVQSENVRKWVIENGSNLVDYSYDTSIEEMYNRVKLTSDSDDSLSVLVNDNKSEQRYGVLQYYEKVNEELTSTQLTDKANTLLVEGNKVDKVFNLNNVIGISDIVTGTAVYVVVDDLNIKQGYYVESDTHIFKGKSHMMSLKLSETDDLVVVDAGTSDRE